MLPRMKGLKLKKNDGGLLTEKYLSKSPNLLCLKTCANLLLGNCINLLAHLFWYENFPKKYPNTMAPNTFGIAPYRI